MTQKVKALIAKSKDILLDSSLENGAIIAANSDMDYYPRQAKDYHYVWPRDAAFICVAAKLAGITNIQEPFFRWLEFRPQDFKKRGKLYANYSTNGRIVVRQFQPDQAGAMLWAIHDFYAPHFSETQKQESLIRRLADGLADGWKESYFFENTVDLWEEGHRRTSTKVENNHTYSLAACIRGLQCADIMLGSKRWKETSDQMLTRLDDAYSHEHKYFLRTHGKIDDLNIDASMLGISYPFDIVSAADERMLNTAQAIEKNLVVNGGVHRYQFDYYDGEGSAQEGGGAWPLLNFWLASFFQLAGQTKKAQTYFNWVVDRVEDDLLIPEQIFEDFRKGIKPLAWSHAMFIIAAHHLGYIKSDGQK